MKTASIFLNGKYPDNQLDFYAEEISKGVPDKRTIIAVDGGLRLLRKLGVKPDLLTGDLDSVEQEDIDWYNELEGEILEKPNQNITDGEFTIIYCLKKGFEEIILYGGTPPTTELDHVIGNIIMMKKGQDKIKILDFDQEIHLLKDNKISIKDMIKNKVSVIPFREFVIGYCLNNGYHVTGNSASKKIAGKSKIDKKICLVENNYIYIKDSIGKKVSVIPFKDSKICYDGFEYGGKIEIKFGSTQGMRNTPVKDSAKISVEGSALVVRYL